MNHQTAKRIYGKKRSYLHKAEIMGVRPAKRTGMPGVTFVAFLLIFLMLFPAASALPELPGLRKGGGPEPAPARGPAVVEDKLFLRSNGTGGTPYLSTIAGPASTTRTLPLDFVLQHPLNASVEVAGKDMIQGNLKGMWLWFQVLGVPTISTITIQIFQNDQVVANGNMPLTTGLNRWDVPFTSSEESHLFPAGSVFKVNIRATPAATIQFNSAESYILMPMTTAPLSAGIGTYYAAGKATTEFHPNWPDSVRRIRTEGDIVSLFGPSDIREVVVTIRNPSGDIASNGTAQLTGEHYLSFWNYSRGQVPGNYNVTAKALDQQGHDYYAYMMVTMLRYAVFISSPQEDTDGIVKGVASPPRGGSEEKDAVYTLHILNSGYSATTVTMRVSSDPPPGWTATLSTTSVASVEPGATSNITFTVSPSSDVDFGNRAVIYVEAIADADTRTPKASWTIQTLTNATMSRNLDFSLGGASEAWVDVGQTASYPMLARNKGVLGMNVTFTVAGQPVGWNAQLDVTGIVSLSPNSERSLTLRVTAPSEEVANLSRIAQLTVTAQVLEDNTLEKRITTVTRLITILGLTMDKAAQTSDPAVAGGRVDFKATITNMDPLLTHQVRLTVTPPAEWPLASLSYQPKETSLSPNGTTTIIISVTPPLTAEANTDSGYTLTIKVEPLDQISRSNSTTVIVRIKPTLDISLKISSTSSDASPGQKISLTLTLENLGNSNTNVVLYVAAGIPQDWRVHLNDVLSPPNPLTITLAPSGRAGAIQTVNLTIQPSKTTRDNTGVRIAITATPGPGIEKTAAVKVTVKKAFPDKLLDSIMDSLLIIVLSILVLAVFAVVLRRSARTA